MARGRRYGTMHTTFGALFLTALIAACGQQEPVYTAKYRFVSPALRGQIIRLRNNEKQTLAAVKPATPDSTAAYPRVAIRDDSRFVIDAPRRARVIWKRQVLVRDDGTISIEATLPAGFQDARTLYFAPMMRVDSEWHTIPGRYVVRSPDDARQTLALTFSVPGVLVDKLEERNTDITLEAIEVPPASETQYILPAVRTA